MKLWPRTLGIQLIVVTAAAVIVSNLAVSAWFEFGNEQHSENELNERVLERAVSTAKLLAAIPFHARPAAAHAMGTGFWSFSIRQGKPVPAQMTDAEEKLAEKLRAMMPADKAQSLVSVRMAFMRPPDNGRGRIHRLPTRAIQLVVPVVRGNQLIATFYRPPAPGWSKEVIVAAFMAVVVASAAAAYVARRVARPLSALASSATAAAQGGTAPRVPEEGPDDVRNAAIAFNAMTDRVTRTMESQRQLLSAVGHDLRTPLTAMRINLEFVEDHELRERLESNLNELQTLTEAVLSAARGTGGEPKRNVDLSALVESLCADLDDRGEPVRWQPHEPAPLICRPDEIRRAVRNLVENAIAYGKCADVHIAATETAYEIVVDDDGPGIAECDQLRVFEPFVRLESSRNAETGGTGLGLTLVKTIAQGHGGAVILENRAGGGLRVRLCLPREPMTA